MLTNLDDEITKAYSDASREAFNQECGSVAAHLAGLRAVAKLNDVVKVPRDVAEHLYGSTLEVGSHCHKCEEFRRLVDEKWPAERRKAP